MRWARAGALLFGGLLAGAFGYGAVNVVYAFRKVTPETRFTFHTALMSVNGVVMQALMGLTIASCLAVAVLGSGRTRWIGGAATTLAVASFLITRFGNVPINQHIKQWAVGIPPSDYPEILARWEAFHFARTGCALVAFLLIVGLTLREKVARDTITA
ncbi:anthrone oxygenase family protein [Nocardia sp. NPDC127579]|uniref:anthrone oxygenase family protein n=1 Tax=Nocardia sp. NPDC127579 TaxID=3345402 RepID=UPI003636FB71